MATRLQKFIAANSTYSRRHAEEMIAAGRISVNGIPITTMGTTIDPATDVIAIDGEPLAPVSQFRYVALHKPIGVISTRAHYAKEKTVFALVPNADALVIAGRLDKDSDGLILLTNDGALVNELTHPKYGHTKEYEVVLANPLSLGDITALRHGIKLDEGIGTFDEFKSCGPDRYRIVLHQGWKRQIRRMLAEVHAHVISLTRVRINKLELGPLKPGEWRDVQRSDIL